MKAFRESVRVADAPGDVAMEHLAMYNSDDSEEPEAPYDGSAARDALREKLRH